MAFTLYTSITDYYGRNTIVKVFCIKMKDARNLLFNFVNYEIVTVRNKITQK